MVFSFSGGLTQTDWFGLTTGTIATAASGLGYNQACYASNVSMRQNQQYQEKNYHLAWAGVARDDIRSMMGITIERIQNYTLVATLIVSMVWACLLASSFSEGCPDIIKHAFWVSMGISIEYFALSIMFAVKGQNKAFVNTMRLLTWECRPENPARYDHDYMAQAQQFEKDGVRSIFRLPGMSAQYAEPTQEEVPSSKREGRKQLRSETMVAAKQHEQRGPKSNAETGSVGSKRRQEPHEAQDQKSSPLEEVRPKTRQLAHLARFANFMQLWQPYDTQAKHCIGIGLLSLVQGAMYWTLGKFSGKTHSLLSLDATALFLLTLMIVLLYIVVMVYETSVKFNRRFTKWSVMVLFCGAPTMGCLATLLPEPLIVRQILAPTCALMHCLLFVIGYIQSFAEMKKPSEITEKFITGPNGQKFTEFSQMDEELGQCTQSASEKGDLDLSTTNPQEQAEATAVRDSVRRSVRASLLLASVIWFFVFVSSFSPLLELERHVENVEEVPLQWTSRSVFPHAIAVAGEDAFVADKYRVFRVPVLGGTPQEVPCNFTGTIADVAATCESEGAQECHPRVLLEGDRPRVVDCATGEESLILQQSSHDRVGHFALHSGKMLALLGNDVVEYRSQEELHSWRPLWEKAQDVGNDVRSLDYDAQRLYIFEQSDSSSKVALADIQYGNQLGRWTVPPQFSPIVAGAATGDGAILFLPKGPAPTLLKWVPPL